MVVVRAILSPAKTVCSRKSKSNMRSTAVILGCFVSCVVNAETWVCRDFDRFGLASGDPVIVAETGETDGTGSIELAGTRHSTRYEILELNHLWLWIGGQGGTSRYAFRIHPDRSGALFDLGVVEDDEAAPAAQVFICEQERRQES